MFVVHDLFEKSRRQTLHRPTLKLATMITGLMARPRIVNDDVVQEADRAPSPRRPRPRRPGSPKAQVTVSGGEVRAGVEARLSPRLSRALST